MKSNEMDEFKLHERLELFILLDFFFSKNKSEFGLKEQIELFMLFGFFS